MIRREEGRKKVRIHIVQKGDTLWKIAKEYGISFEDLKRLNVHLANPDYIVPGMEIILPERIHKEAPVQPKHHVKESVKKEVPKPPPPPAPAPPKPAPMPMPEPQMIPIPFPMPMPMPQPQPQMWMQPPLEMNWNQQLIMPQMEQPALPPIHIQTPAPQPAPVPPPIPQPAPLPAPAPQPPMHIMPQMPHVPHCTSCHQPPMHIMPQMPMIPHCSSCHQPIHHQMMWPMPQMQMPMQMPMPSDEGQYTMPAYDVKGAEKFQESSSFSSLFDVKHKHQHQEMNQPCGTPSHMMPEHHMNHYQSPCAPWMPPQFYPGGMTPYRW